MWFGSPTLTFSPPHDRRNQVNALFSLSKNGFRLSPRWQYGSGTPFSEAPGVERVILVDCAVDVRVRDVPDRMDPKTYKIYCRKEKTYRFKIKFTGSEIRRGR